jgi:hypothetical protein
MDLDKDALDLMEFADGIGSFRLPGSLIREIGPSLDQSGNRNSRDRYRGLLKRTEPGFVFERIHGRGNLLDLDHPSVRKFIKTGLIKEHEIQAATRHRGTTVPAGG